MLRTIKYAVLVLVLMAQFSCQQREHVDMILKNAKIYTVNSSFAVMQSAAVSNGRFVAISSDANILARYTSDSILDLKGKYVYPGFIDAHAHFSQFAVSLAQADLSGASELADIIRILAEYQQDNHKIWIVAKNLPQSFLVDSVVTDNKLFNKLFAKTPVFVWTAGYGEAIINDAFIRKSGFVTDSQSGILIGSEAQRASRLIPSPGESEMKSLYKRAEQECFNVGITSTSDYGAICANVELLDQMQKSNELRLPVYAILEPSAENIEKYVSKVPYYTDNLKALSVGFGIDGRLSQHSAVLLSPYPDGASNGELKVSADSLRNICRLAYEHGFQMCVGCVGDSATRLVLEAYSEILPHKNNARWRVENLHMVDRKDLRLFSHFSVMPSVQPMQYQFCKDFMQQMFDKKLMKECFAWKRLLDQNQGIISGTNAPYGMLNPMAVFYASVRQEKHRVHNKQSQEMTTTQALKALTIWAAYSQFDEKNKGSIEVGKWADFIVTDGNITTMYQPNLPGLNVKMTYLHGKRVK